MPDKRMIPITVPDFDLPDSAVQAGVWHVSAGERVRAGDRLLEVVADSVLIDIPAPESGVLRRRLVQEDERLAVGQVIALLEVTDER